MPALKRELEKIHHCFNVRDERCGRGNGCVAIQTLRLKQTTIFSASGPCGTPLQAFLQRNRRMYARSAVHLGDRKMQSYLVSVIDDVMITFIDGSRPERLLYGNSERLGSGTAQRNRYCGAVPEG
jgi:hypothetical protein